MSTDYVIATVPNEGDPQDTVARRIKTLLSGNADVFRMDLPTNLLVGTLDTLMSLSDDLQRIDSLVENVARKIEKQYFDVVGYDSEPLRVAQLAPDTYLRQFEWDYAKYAVRQPLPQLVGHIQASVGKIEEELRNLGMAYQEKSGAVLADKRKKGSSLATADLNEVLTEEKLRGITLLNTEHLETLIVVMGKDNQRDWLESYASIGSDIAAMGSPDWSSPQYSERIGQASYGQHGPEFTERTVVKGSPAVPGSSVKILEDGESCLYTVTVLKGQYQAGFYDGEQFQQGMVVDYVEPFKKAAKELRFTARSFNFDPEHAGEVARKQAQIKVETQQLHIQLVRWCKAHFGEALIAWVHIKLIRMFVESVLRYGLPVDFTTLLVYPKAGKESSCIMTLDKAYATVVSMGPQAAAGEDKDKDELHAFVHNKFTLLSI